MELDQDRLRIAERAAEWHQRLSAEGTRAPSDRDKAAFFEWLDQSPVHVREFLLAQAFDVEASRLEWEPTIDVNALLAGSAANVVPLRPENAGGEAAVTDSVGELAARPQRRPARAWLWRAAAALVLGVGVVLSLQWSGGKMYSTAIGELKTVELSDGSTVQLSAGSQLRVRYSRHARELELLRGEALFNVEHDVTRPFNVRSAGSVVQAVGTRFDVDRREGSIVVAVLEGKVRVFADIGSAGTLRDVAGTGARAELLAANEQLRLDTRGHVQRRETLQVGDLQPQRLVFRDDTLADIAAEFNRYNQRLQIVIADERAGAKRYGGFFYADDPESFVDFIGKDSEISVARMKGRAVISMR